MGGMDGVMAAKTLREQGCGSIIILVTNYIQYAIDGYEFNAFHFLKKPVEYERFCRVVGQAMRLVYRNAHATLAVKCEEGLRQLTVRTISYCETDRGGVLLHLPGETVRCRRGIAQLEQQLQTEDFFPLSYGLSGQSGRNRAHWCGRSDPEGWDGAAGEQAPEEGVPGGGGRFLGKGLRMIQMLLQPVSFSDLLSCLGYAAAYETFFRRMRTELTWKRRLFMLLADLTGYLILMRLLPRTEYLRVLLLHLILAAASTLQLRLECRLDWSYAVFLGTSFVLYRGVWNAQLSALLLPWLEENALLRNAVNQIVSLLLLYALQKWVVRMDRTRTVNRYELFVSLFPGLRHVYGSHCNLSLLFLSGSCAGRPWRAGICPAGRIAGHFDPGDAGRQ